MENVEVKDGQITMFFQAGNVSRLNAIVIKQMSGEVEPTVSPEPTGISALCTV